MPKLVAETVLPSFAVHREHVVFVIDIGYVRQLGPQALLLALAMIVRRRDQRPEMLAKRNLLRLGHRLAAEKQHRMGVEGIVYRSVVRCRNRLCQIDAADFRHEQRMQLGHGNHARLPQSDRRARLGRRTTGCKPS